MRIMENKNKLATRRDFLLRSSASLAAFGAFSAGCKQNEKEQDFENKNRQQAISNKDSLSWWHKSGFMVHETVDTKKISNGMVRAYVDGAWQEFRVIELPDSFITWSMKTRIMRLKRILAFGGLDPRDLAGSHNACVATYGGPSRDSVISLNTAYKGMGFAIKANWIAEVTQRIKEEQIMIENDSRGNPAQEINAKVRFLTEFYSDTSRFDLTKQVSLELFSAPDFHTHTFLNMMANPIASASFLAFPTFEIRAVPQLLHPKNPCLTEYEKNLIAFTNAIHDFIHRGSEARITCVYHIIELFDDTPNDKGKGRRIA